MFHAFEQLCRSHPIFLGALAMALANAAVTAMPSPRANGSALYAWTFNFLHSAVGALSRIAAQYKSGKSATRRPA